MASITESLQTMAADAVMVALGVLLALIAVFAARFLLRAISDWSVRKTFRG